MGVPAHDTHFQFAKAKQLPIQVVIAPTAHHAWSRSYLLQEAYTEPGIVINTDRFDGMVSTDAKQAIVQYAQQVLAIASVSATGLAHGSGTGRPIPVIHCPSCGTLPV